MKPQVAETRNVEIVRVLLAHLIDYAGLFPPAGLNMPQAVANYDKYLRSEYSWMLGRFIVPAARLSEFETAFEPLTSGAGTPWALSALFGADSAGDLVRINAFNRKQQKAAVESVEVKATTPEQVRQLARVIPRGFAAYFEIPLEGREAECIAAVAECGRGAKIRTGGETADKFPDPARVVEFMKLCADSRVPFKATAGLHHPLRSVQRLTCEPDSASTLMHGFLNVFLAAAFLRAGMQKSLAVELLEEQSAQAIRFEAEGIAWGGHRLTSEQMSAARQTFAVSFGSCSFTEPVDELRSFGLL